MIIKKDDTYWMRKALALARKAQSLGEVPIGALIVKDNQVIATAYNLREKHQSPLSHAEMIAIHKAAKKLNSWRLEGCTLYVTLEPCVMCAGTLWQSRIERVVFGARDPKGGAVETLYQIGSDTRLNHRYAVVGGVLEKECGKILSDFFKKLRKNRS